MGLYALLYKHPVISRIVALIIPLILAFLCSSTYVQTKYWKSDQILWSRVVDLYPGKIAKAHVNLGNTYLESGDFKQAEYHYNIARNIQPDNIANLMNIILVYEKTGRQSMAHLMWKMLVKKYPGNPWLWLEFGDFNQRHKDHVSALRAYQIALEKSKYSKEIREALRIRGLIIQKK